MANNNCNNGIENWIKRGMAFVFPEMAQLWEECVKVRASDLYRGFEVDCALAIMEKLEKGATFEEAKQLLDSQKHSGTSWALTRHIIFTFYKTGPEFWEYTAFGELSDETKEIIENKKRENAKLLKLHS